MGRSRGAGLEGCIAAQVGPGLAGHAEPRGQLQGRPPGQRHRQGVLDVPGSLRPGPALQVCARPLHHRKEEGLGARALPAPRGVGCGVETPCSSSALRALLGALQELLMAEVPPGAFLAQGETGGRSRVADRHIHCHVPTPFPPGEEEVCRAIPGEGVARPKPGGMTTSRACGMAARSRTSDHASRTR